MIICGQCDTEVKTMESPDHKCICGNSLSLQQCIQNNKCEECINLIKNYESRKNLQSIG